MTYNYKEYQRKYVKQPSQITETDCKLGHRRRERRFREKRYRERRPRDKKSRITKVKSNSRRSTSKTFSQAFRLSKIGRCKSCQCSSSMFAQDKESGKSNETVQLYVKPSKVRQSDVKCTETNTKQPQSKNSNTSQHFSNPGSIAPSLSSYNSYLSVNHEPMVQP